MVWFQCEDCGENLKKPKLPNHFRMCSAYKLSCIDCGEMFNQQTVQSHTQCITEMEKYGPKNQGKASDSASNKSNKPKPNSDVDVNVGLSSRPPWFCSLCNTQATSKQTLMLHADGKKHRAKARAFHASQKQSTQVEDATPDGTRTSADAPKLGSVEANGVTKKDEPMSREPPKDPLALVTEEKGSLKKSKRKHDASTELTTDKKKTADALNNGEVVQTERQKLKKKKCTEIGGNTDNHDQSKEASQNKIKWKKLVISTLKSNPDGVMKLKKLQKLVIKGLLETGVNDDESQLQDMLIDKISSSSRFVIDKKCIRLASKNEES